MAGEHDSNNLLTEGGFDCPYLCYNLQILFYVMNLRSLLAASLEYIEGE